MFVTAGLTIFYGIFSHSIWMWRIFHRRLLVLQNIVMDLKNILETLEERWMLTTMQCDIWNHAATCHKVQLVTPCINYSNFVWRIWYMIYIYIWMTTQTQKHCILWWLYMESRSESYRTKVYYIWTDLSESWRHMVSVTISLPLRHLLWVHLRKLRARGEGMELLSHPYPLIFCVRE